MQQSKKYKIKATNFAFSKVNSNSVKYFKNSDTTQNIKKTNCSLQYYFNEVIY